MKTLLSSRLPLRRWCPLLCWNCRKLLLMKNVKYRADDVARAKQLNMVRLRTASQVSLPRPYCPKCVERLGVEPYSEGN